MGMVTLFKNYPTTFRLGHIHCFLDADFEITLQDAMIVITNNSKRANKFILFFIMVK